MSLAITNATQRPAQVLAAGSPEASDLSRAWDQAVAQYVKTSGFPLQEPVAQSVDDVLALINEKERLFAIHRHNGSKTDRFRSLVADCLVPIQRISEMSATVVNSVFTPAECIFSAVSNIIKTSQIVSKDYDKVSEVFEQISEVLREIKVWDDNLPPIPQLVRAIVDIFVSMLALCAICTKYIKQNRFEKTLRALFTGEDNDLKLAYETLKEAVRRQQRVVANATLSGIQYITLQNDTVHQDVRDNLRIAERIEQNLTAREQHMSSLIQGAEQAFNQVAGNQKRQELVLSRFIANQERQESEQQREATLKWLSALDFRHKHRSCLAKHQEGTGVWLLSDKSFQEWYEGEQNSTLWCPGIPGAGKTVLMSSVICHAEETTSSTEVAIAYVYCDYQDKETRSGAKLLSSIVQQLADHIRPLPREVGAFRDRFGNRKNHSLKAREDAEVSLIMSLSSWFKRTFVFIDALDECSDDDRDEIIRLLRRVESSIRLFITSRPHVDLHAKFSRTKKIQIVPDRSDIHLYIEAQIEKNIRLKSCTDKDPTLKEDIIQAVYKQTDGMFLLTYFQLLHLSMQIKPKKVRQALETLPKDMNEFYEGAMLRIEEQEDEVGREVAKKALSYIFCAKRPFQMVELLQALSVERGDDEFDEVAIAAETLLGMTAGLIRYDPASGALGLVHMTLQEYLARYPQKLLADPEAEIAVTCLTYLGFDDFKEGPCPDEANLQVRLGAYPFLNYASRFWGAHVSVKQDEEQMELVSVLFEDEQKLAASLQVLHAPRQRLSGWHDRYPKNFTVLHAAAYWGLDQAFSAVGILQEGETDIDSTDSDGTTAILLAAQHGQDKVVQILLTRGAHVDIRNNRGQTALSWASRNGHKATVESLLSAGSEVKEEDSEGWTPLHWAIINGHFEIVKLLLAHSDDRRDDKTQQNKALQLAAEAGDSRVVQMLLEYGADVGFQDVEGSPPLHYAVPEGHENVVRVLLHNGVDVNQSDNYKNTALHWAIASETITRLLLENGALVNAQNDTGASPLYWAAQGGHLKTVRLLVESGAQVDMANEHGCTALHAAALKGYEEIAELLLSKGADPKNLDKDNWTPLHAAVLRGHDKLVRLLVDKVPFGEQAVADLTSRLQQEDQRNILEEIAVPKAEGSTVVSGLRMACNSGYTGRVLALLDGGADIDAIDAEGGNTALTTAAWICKHDIVQILLESGADPDKRENSGKTALYIAAEDGFTEVARMLIDAGADVNLKVYGWTPLLAALRQWYDHPKESAEIVEYLIMEGASIEARDYHGRTALHWAANCGSEHMIALLIDTGAEVNSQDSWGRTPLAWAIESYKPSTAHHLPARGADLTIRAKDGTTVLHSAVFAGYFELVIQLLEKGADVNAQALDGLTPLHVATVMEYEPIATILLKRGAGTRGTWLISDDVGDEADDRDKVSKFSQLLDANEYDSLSKRLNTILKSKAKDRKTEARGNLTAQELAAINQNDDIYKLLEGLED